MNITQPKIEPVGLQRFVVVFDPKWCNDPGNKSAHTIVLEETFPSGTLFYGVSHFTGEAIGEGRISPLLHPSDLVELYPLVFIVDAILNPSVRSGERERLAIKLIENFKIDKRTSRVEVALVAELWPEHWVMRALDRLGVAQDKVYLWPSLIESHGFRRKMKALLDKA